MAIKVEIRKNSLLLKNILSLSTLNGLNVLLPLISLPYILRVIGADNFGSYSYVYVLIQYLLIVSLYGFNYSATKQVSQNRDDFAKIGEIYNSVTCCRVVLLLGGLILMAAFQSLILRENTERIMFLMGIGMVVGDIFTPIWLFQGLEKMGYITFINLITKSLSTLCLFFFIKEPSDYPYILLISSMGYLLAGILSSIILKKRYNLVLSMPSRLGIVYQFKDGFALFSSSVGINLYNNANVFILRFFVSDYYLGIYAAAERTIRGLKLVSSPISQALYPHLGYKFKNQSLGESLAQLKKTTMPFALMLLAFSVLTLIFSHFLIQVVAGEEYLEGKVLISIMSGTILLGGLNSLLGLSGLVNLNKQRDFLVGVFIAGFFCIGFLLLLIPLAGIKAAAWASVLSELVLLCWILISLYRLKKPA